MNNSKIGQDKFILFEFKLEYRLNQKIQFEINFLKNINIDNDFHELYHLYTLYRLFFKT